jgi:hypothetical protein
VSAQRRVAKLKLTEALKERVVQRLDAAGFLKQACPTCHEHRWKLSDRVEELREYSGGALALGGDQTVIPIIVAFCDNCGTIVPFNALILGVVDKTTGQLVDEPPTPEAPK